MQDEKRRNEIDKKNTSTFIYCHHFIDREYNDNSSYKWRKNTKPLYEDTFDTSQFKTITLENLKEYVDTDEYKVLVMGKPNCEYTNKMIPILEQAQDKFGYETLYVDLRNITEKDREVILSYDDETKFIEEYLGSTPFIIVFKNNQMIDTWVGYQDYLVFEKFLTSLGLEFEEN